MRRYPDPEHDSLSVGVRHRSSPALQLYSPLRNLAYSIQLHAPADRSNLDAPTAPASPPLQRRHCRGLRALAGMQHLVLDVLPLDQPREHPAPDRGAVDEDVAAVSPRMKP